MWFSKLRLKFLHSLARLVAIEPFLTIDPCAYCPCCGARDPKSKIRAVVLTQPDSAGSKVAVLHECATDGFQWLESSVSIVTEHAMDAPVDAEQQDFIEMRDDKRTKNIRSAVVVNGGR